MTANDDYDEIVIYAHQDEVEGGFEKQGPAPTPWFKLLKGYIFRSPSLWTTFLLAVILFFSLKYSGYFKSEQFLNEYPFYQQYPKEFLSLVKTRIIFWSVLVPAALVPLLTALFGLSGLWPSKIGRIQATVKVESWIMLFIALYLITQMPLAKLLHNSDIFFMNLNNPKIQQYLKGK